MAFTWSEVSTPASGGAVIHDIVWADTLSLFVAIGSSGLVYTSPDGATWTKRTASATNAWNGIAWSTSLGLLVAVASNGADRVMTSPDGINWTPRSATAAFNWQAVCWSPALALFVAVASSGAGDRVMVSANGTAWTSHPAAAASAWKSVCWSPDLSLLCAVADSSAMTSPDGTNWTPRTFPVNATTSGSTASGSSVLAWSHVAGVFCFAGSDNISGNRQMCTSPDGTTWTVRSIPSPAISLGGISADNAGFVAFRQSGANRAITSPDGITWTGESTTANRTWDASAWSSTSQTVVSWDAGGTNHMLVGLGASVGTVAPARGTARGGTVCTITGTGLSAVTAVTFGGTAAAGVVAAADGLSVTCITPAHASGAVDVVVTGVGTLTAAYTYVTVTRVTPNRGTTFGGTSVVITGAGFDLATGVTFDGVTATQISYESATSISCVTPLHASGAVTVAVAGVDTLANGYTYAVPVSPLPPYPYYAPMVQDGTSPGGLTSTAWANWWNVVKARIEALPGSVAAENVIGVLAPAQIPTLPWSRISKTGASLADLQYPGVGGNGQYLGSAGGVPVWRTFGATLIPTNFDPGSGTIGAAQFLAFPGYVTLAVGEALTMGVGAVLRVF